MYKFELQIREFLYIVCHFSRAYGKRSTTKAIDANSRHSLVSIGDPTQLLPKLKPIDQQVVIEGHRLFKQRPTIERSKM